jgi:hypothetical protein
MKKIIVRLQGGLGNQLFQYAFGKFLSIKYNCKLKLDVSLYKYYDLHDYSLEPYNLHEDLATSTDVPNQYLTNKRILKKLFTIGNKYLGKIEIIKEQSLKFDAELLNQNNDIVYLDGYWQSELYFDAISEQIREKLFVNSENIPNSYNKYLQKIRESNSISIHIRRGSYTIEKYKKVHGLTPIEYYNKSIQLIKKRVKSVNFFVFSDDTQWIKEKFNSLKNSTIIEGTPEKDYLDIFLMSQCKHNIIANSTFSWWGAWLNSNPDKIVIAPKNWYLKEEFIKTTNSLVPNKWIRL